jgi:ubiquinone/menaquinone biosynthesis C-methylase UbiE
MGMVESMRRDWDERARKDAFYYIASWRKDWDLAGFLQSGDEDYERLVLPVLERFKFSADGKTMLELGCGAGRMTQSFSTHFGRVFAFDVSSQMLERAREFLHGRENIVWVHGNGVDLGSMASESVDFVFSYLVLQHLPDEKLVRAYIREMLRVLRESGLCLFQVDGMKRPTMNWKGRLVWGLIDTLWVIHLSRLSRAISKLLGLDPEMAGKSWHGTAVTAQSVAEALNASGGTVLEIWGENTAMAWFCARKVATRTDKANHED